MSDQVSKAIKAGAIEKESKDNKNLIKNSKVSMVNKKGHKK